MRHSHHVPSDYLVTYILFGHSWSFKHPEIKRSFHNRNYNFKIRKREQVIITLAHNISIAMYVNTVFKQNVYCENVGSISTVLNPLLIYVPFREILASPSTIIWW